MSGAFRALVAADGLLVAVHDEIIDAILERAVRLDAEKAAHIGLVLAEEEIARLVDGKLAVCHAGVSSEHLAAFARSQGFSLSASHDQILRVKSCGRT